MKKRVLLLGILVLSTLLLSCAKKEAPVEKPELQSLAEQQVVTPKEPWEVEWEKTIKLAKKEGNVVIYSSLGGDITTILRQAFKEKYGVGVEFLSGRGTEIAQKIIMERRAGLYLADLWQGGATTLVSILKPVGVFDPLEPALVLPEVVNPKLWLNGKLEFVDRDRTIFPFLTYAVAPLVINRNLVRAEDIKSYRDFLSPAWKGKIVMNDPMSQGAGLAWFGAVSEGIMGMDYMRELARQEPVITRDRHLQMLWLSQGKYSLAIAPQPDILSTFERDGAPIKRLVTQEGAYSSGGTGNISLINKAPHPNAARLYVNWLLSREAQALHSKAVLLPSSRVDVEVSTDYIDPFNIMQPGVKYFNIHTEEFMLRENQRIKVATEIFGHLVK